MRTKHQGAASSGLAAYLVAVALFSWGFILVRVVDLPPAMISTYRLSIGGTALTLIALIWRTPWPRLSPALVTAGLSFGAHQLLFVEATKQTSVAVVTFAVAALQPLLVAMVSRRLVRERLRPALWGYLSLAVLGVALAILGSLQHATHTLQGDLLAIINVVAFTSYFVAAKRSRMEGAHALTFTASFNWIALIVVLPAALWTGPALPTRVDLALLLVMALGPGNGHLLVNWAHTRLSAAIGALILALVPLLASLWAALLLGESYSWHYAIATLLVAISITAARTAEPKRTR